MAKANTVATKPCWERQDQVNQAASLIFNSIRNKHKDGTLDTTSFCLQAPVLCPDFANFKETDLVLDQIHSQ